MRVWRLLSEIKGLVSIFLRNPNGYLVEVQRFFEVLYN